MKRLNLSLCLLGLLITSSLAIAQNHSNAIETLEAILKTAWDDKELTKFLLNRPGAKDDKNYYHTMFSKPLINSLRKYEQSLIKQYCNGAYKEGESCGISFNPITCTQDISEPFILDNVKHSSKNATIKVSMPFADTPTHTATYRMIKQGKVWLLDGVACADGPTFNIEK
jgi:hypothetical protein